MVSEQLVIGLESHLQLRWTEVKPVVRSKPALQLSKSLFWSKLLISGSVWPNCPSANPSCWNILTQIRSLRSHTPLLIDAQQAWGCFGCCSGKKNAPEQRKHGAANKAGFLACDLQQVWKRKQHICLYVEMIQCDTVKWTDKTFTWPQHVASFISFLLKVKNSEEAL